jgi:fimbrial chaperone protein
VSTRISPTGPGLLAVLVLLAPLALGTGPARALTIAPVIVELSPARRVVSITITNPADRAIAFQASPRSWTLEDGADRYEDTDEILVVPQIAEIPPGGRQIFRVTARVPAVSVERAYRLVFEDVSEAVAQTTEVAVTLRVDHDLPVFVAPPGRPRAEARISACAPPQSEGTGCVRIDNDGNRYLQVRSLTVEGEGWRKEETVNARVLAGGWRQWNYALPQIGAVPSSVTASTGDGPVSVPWPLPPR